MLYARRLSLVLHFLLQEILHFHVYFVPEELLIVKTTIVFAVAVFWVQKWEEDRVLGEVLHLFEEGDLLFDRLRELEISFVRPELDDAAVVVVARILELSVLGLLLIAEVQTEQLRQQLRVLEQHLLVVHPQEYETLVHLVVAKEMRNTTTKPLEYLLAFDEYSFGRAVT